jgi:hypothetical protein
MAGIANRKAREKTGLTLGIGSIHLRDCKLIGLAFKVSEAPPKSPKGERRRWLRHGDAASDVPTRAGSQTVRRREATVHLQVLRQYLARLFRPERPAESAGLSESQFP